MEPWATPTEASTNSARPGSMLGARYELKALIASGGMAQVWLAVDKTLDREVAAKILHPHLATDEEFVHRFRREAVASASLTHNSIVSVFDTISTDGIEAIVMELIDGHTLRAVLDERGPLPADEVVHIAVQVASALDTAHRAGIVHRDIKPANIMVCHGNRVTVTDFGIAKAGTDSDLTQTGTLLGTAKYLSPEQVSGESVDPRSDLYSLGVVMYEALTGSPPFRASTDAATALARLQVDPPPLRSLRSDVPAPLADVVGKLMARNPDDRYGRASQLLDVLLGLEPFGTGTDRPAPVGRRMGDDTRPPDGHGTRPAADGADHPRPPEPPPFLRVGPALQTPVFDPAVTGPAGPGGSVAGPPPRDPASADTDPSFEPLSPPSTNGPTIGGADQAGFQVLGVEPAADAGSSTVSSGRVVRSGRSRLVSLTVIALVVVAIVVAGVLLTDVETMMGIGGDDEINELDESGPGLAIAVVSSFDPQSPDPDKEEREDLTGFAADGDRETAWSTESYRRGGLSGLKSGVGLLIHLEESLPLNRIELDTNTEGWVAEVYVGDGFADDGSDWGEAAATIDAGSNRVVRDLGRAEGRVVLLWVRDTGLTGGQFRFELTEVVVR